MLSWVVSALLALSAWPARGEARDAATERLGQHPWAAWVDGSWTRYETADTLGSRVASRESLLSLGPRTYRVLLETELLETGAELERAYALLGYPRSMPEADEAGSEAIEVGGTPIACTVWSARWRENGAAFEVRAWLAPGSDQPLRVSEARPDGTLELSATELDDWILIARRKFRCTRYEGWALLGGERIRVEEWRSSEIPGGLARRIARRTTPQGPVVQTTQVVEFRGEKRR
jgi:hypothetical protein